MDPRQENPQWLAALGLPSLEAAKQLANERQRLYMLWFANTEGERLEKLKMETKGEIDATAPDRNVSPEPPKRPLHSHYTCRRRDTKQNKASTKLTSTFSDDYLLIFIQLMLSRRPVTGEKLGVTLHRVMVSPSFSS